MEVINSSERQQSQRNKKRKVGKFCIITVLGLMIVIGIFVLHQFNPSVNIQGRFIDIVVDENQASSTLSNNSDVKCAAINNKNELIMWNNNEWKKPKKVLDDVKLTKLFYTTNMAIKNDNSLWVWGDNQYEQIGNITTSEIPQKLLDDVKSVDNYGGDYYVKDSYGDYWQWGEEKKLEKINSDKELSEIVIKHCEIVGLIGLYLYADGHLEGDFVEENSVSHVRETIFEDIEDIADSGGDQGLILAKDETLYYIGNGLMSFEYPVASKCKYVREMCKNVKGAYCGNNFCIVLTNNGELYSCGNNESGCLGNKDIVQTDNSLKLIMESVEDFGTSNFSNIGSETKLAIESQRIIEHEYILARKNDGTLYGWGDNEGKQIGTGKNDKIIKKPTKIMDNVKKCVSCNGYNFALTNDGDIFRWGYYANRVPKKITK